MKKHMYLISVFLLLTSLYCQNLSNTSNSSVESQENLPPFNYTLPDFTNALTTFANMSNILGNYLYESAWQDLFNYMSNKCDDNRVPKLFEVNQTDSPDDYQGFCVLLATDFFQNYDNYTCNDWVCNFKGKCSFVVNSDLTVNQTCTCTSGNNGPNCVYSNQNYKYILSIVNGTASWINLKKNNNNGNLFGGKNDEYLSYLDMATNLLFVGLSAVSDSSLNPSFQILISPFFNSGLNLTSDQQESLQGYIELVLSEPRLMSLVNPLDLAAITNSQKVDKNFGSYDQEIDPNADSTLTFSSGARRNLFELVRKFLQTTNTTKTSNSSTSKSTASQPAKGINMDNPRCTIPKDITSKLPTGSKLSLSFVRDPKTYNLNTTSLNKNFIVSQVLSIGAKNSGNPVNYPSGVTTSFSCQVPFSSVPLNCSSYQVNCNVISLNNGVWRNETSCSLSATTNSNTAQISCNTFGTVAVSCNKNCSVNTTQMLASTKRVNTTTKSAGSYVYISAIISAVLCFILI